MIRARAAFAGLVLFAMTGLAAARDVTVLSFDDLDGWARDDHAAALAVFRETCPDIDDPEWRALCALAGQQDNARAFFELFFRPVLIEDGQPALFTGYYEPELAGARTKTDTYTIPIYAAPPDLPRAARWHTRREIETEDHLSGKDLEIAWVEHAVDLFFLQIQGSGRIRLEDGSYIRIGYGGSNGHQYRSIGAELVRRGVFGQHQVSADVIRNWVLANPEDGARLLHHNPSYVFFREVNEVPADRGPLGAMNRSVTPMRTIAVDPAFTTLGAPVWVEKMGENPIRRLMIAQDTGSAIKGAQRADIFFGTGRRAGQQAGRIRDGGRMIVLLPIEHAYALSYGG